MMNESPERRMSSTNGAAPNDIQSRRRSSSSSQFLREEHAKYGYNEPVSFAKRNPPGHQGPNTPSREEEEKDMDETPRVHRPGRLSIVSQSYDAGSKGYLTKVEQTMREMDLAGNGYLTNAQVTQMLEQTMELRKVNNRLRNWVIGLFLVVLLLGLSNMGTAFAAARLAKDTETNSDTGEMKVKGTDLRVMTHGIGASLTLQVHDTDGDDEDSSPFACIKTQDLSRLYYTNKEGVDVSLVLEDGVNDTVTVLGISHGLSSFNSSIVIMRTHDGSDVEFDLTSNVCDELYGPGSGSGQRHLRSDSPDSNEAHQRLRYERFLSHLKNGGHSLGEETVETDGRKLLLGNGGGGGAPPSGCYGCQTRMKPKKKKKKD